LRCSAGGYDDARMHERAAIDRDVAEGYVSASSRKVAAAEEQE
jgi:hypothetical protein